MKAGISVPLKISALSLITIFALPCFAQNSSYSGTTTTTAPANSNSSASGQAGTASTATMAENSGSSWRQSVSDAAHNAEVITENVYNQVARGVKDMSLEARINAVLHENKSTRGSDVHVTADNGVVTLTGNVPSERNAQRVQEVVASVYGVDAVNNDLNYPRSGGALTPPDADSMDIAHSAYSDIAPAENAPVR